MSHDYVTIMILADESNENRFVQWNKTYSTKILKNCSAGRVHVYKKVASFKFKSATTYCINFKARINEYVKYHVMLIRQLND